MTPENLKEVLEKIINNKFEYYELYLFISIAITVIVSIISSFVISYLKEKGKNLATKEDISDITTKIENIKQENVKEIENIKQNNQKNFDLFQKQNELHFSELKNTKDRYNSKQFEIYNTLWTSLIELKFSADDLWEEATQKNLKNFSTKVSEAKKSIEISSLLLENYDYKNLNKLLEEFSNFEFGKGSLIKLYTIKNKSNREMTNDYIDDISIDYIIRKNEEIKNSYDTLISDLRIKFKKQLQGNNK